MGQTYENFWPAVASVAVTADSTSLGKVTVPDTTVFWRGQVVSLAGTALLTLQLQVKEVIGASVMYLGPINDAAGIASCTVDLSGYTTAATTVVAAVKQERNKNQLGPPLGMTPLQSAYMGEPINSHRVYNGQVEVLPQYGRVLGTAITNAYVTLLTATKDYGILAAINSCDGDISIAYKDTNAVVTEFIRLEEKSTLVFDMRAANIKVAFGGLIQVKYNSAPSTGSLRVTLL